jgi:branched-chain amino acid transport system substrate-binding protein
MMKKARFGCGIASVGYALVFLAGCAVPPPKPAGDAVVRIGHVAPMSGPIAHLGRDHDFGALLAVEEINAKRLVVAGQPVRLELLTKDDAADPRKAIAVAQELVQAKVAAVVGHLNSGTSIPTAHVYAGAGVAQIAPSVTKSPLTRLGHPGVFRLIADDAALGKRLAQYAREDLKLMSAVVIDDRTGDGQSVADAFDERFRALGGQSLARQYTHSDPSVQSLADVVQTVKAAQPAVIFFGGWDIGASTLLRALRAEGVKAKFMGGNGICTLELPKLANAPIGEVLCAESGWTGLPADQRMLAFREAFKKRFFVDANIFSPYTYDAVYVLADAMQRAGSTESARITQALRATRFSGVTGPIAFDAKGDVIDGAIAVYEYRGNQRTLKAVIR